MPTAAVNGATLHYEVVGEGPLCLVMSGWPGVDHRYLRPGLDGLGDHLRLVYYDHRGQGGSRPAPVATISVGQLADDAEALAAQLGADRFLALGHFHGAMVAQELALRHPDRVAGLVLVSATPGELGALEDLADQLDAPLKPPEAEVLQRVPPATDEELAATMHALAPYFVRETQTVAPEKVFAESTFDAQAATAWAQALTFWSSADRLDRLRAPVLLLTGRHDVFCPPTEAERISRRAPRSELVVLDHSGHVPWLEELGAFLESVRSWLGRL